MSGTTNFNIPVVNLMEPTMESKGVGGSALRDLGAGPSMDARTARDKSLKNAENKYAEHIDKYTQVINQRIQTAVDNGQTYYCINIYNIGNCYDHVENHVLQKFKDKGYRFKTQGSYGQGFYCRWDDEPIV
jgi:hypothetical protein